MFDKKRLASMLNTAKGTRTNQEYSDSSGVSRAYISMILNMKREDPPSPDILKKLAAAAHNDISYVNLMAAAGYVVWLDKDKDELYEMGGVMHEKNFEAIHSSGVILKDNQRFRTLPSGSPILYVRIPIIGTIRAGLPILAEEHYEGFLDVPEDLQADYALQVIGDSMIGAGILEGDYAICREAQDTGSGHIVVAIKEQGVEFSEATLKYYFNNGHGPVLRAANPDYSDINMTEGYRIMGVMVGLLRKDTPSYQEYRNYLAIAGYEEWTKVIENASNNGLNPQQLNELINVHVEMAKKFSRR